MLLTGAYGVGEVIKGGDPPIIPQLQLQSQPELLGTKKHVCSSYF